MNAKNEKHQLVARVIVHRGSDILFVRRSASDSRAGMYEMPGGLVDPGESLEQGALRELKEETGLDTKELIFKETSAYNANGENRLSGIFEAQIEQGEVTLSDEHDDYKWLNASNYDNVQLEPHYKQYFKEYFRTDKTANTTPDKRHENTTYSHIIAYTDGGSRGNPGPSASGYVLMDEDEEILEEGGEYLGVTTNNQAEYQAVKLALEKAKKHQPKEISFFIDSLLVVNQMNGKFKIKAKDLWPIHEAINELAKRFDKVTFTHVRRELNTLADEQVNIVLDSYEHRNQTK